MKSKHFLIFFVIMLGFSIFIPYIMKYMSSNIEDYETSISLPKTPSFGSKDPASKRRIYKTKNSIAVLITKDRGKWVFFDFSEGKSKYDVKWSSLDWDIAFQRVNVLTNSGKTNSAGKVGVIDMGHIDINSVVIAPEDSYYIQDTRSWGVVKNTAITRWYEYSTRTHHVTSKGNVYVIRTADGYFAKMKILDFYCNDGSSGCITIEYKYQSNGTRNLESDGVEKEIEL